MRYLTPSSLRAMGTGFSLDTVPDIDILGMIEEAEGLIDAEAGMDERNSLGFGAGQRSFTQWWNPATRRVNPTSAPVPITSVDSFVIQYGQNLTDGSYQVATIDPKSVVVADDYNYFEIITIAVILAGIAPVLAFTGVIQPLARVTYTAGYSIAKVGWRLYLQAPSDVEPKPVWHSRLPFWDTTKPVVVTRNGVTLTLNTDYTVNGEDGTVDITSGYSVSDTIRASFTHTLPDPIIAVAKGAFREQAQYYFANQNQLAGLDQYTSGASTRRRMQHAGGTWRNDLHAFLGPHIQGGR